MLSDLMTALRAIFDETRSLSVKLEGSGMVEAGTEKPRGGPEAPGNLGPAGVQGRRKGDEAVEIF
jgi:hypothetical protein